MITILKALLTILGIAGVSLAVYLPGDNSPIVAVSFLAIFLSILDYGEQP